MITKSVSISASGLKSQAFASIVNQCSDQPKLADALMLLVNQLQGTRVSVSGSISPTSVSLSASAWTDASDVALRRVTTLRDVRRRLRLALATTGDSASLKLHSTRAWNCYWHD